MKGEVVPAAQELLERDKLVRPIRDEDPHTGDHGQIEVVRVGGALRMRGFDRDTGEWVDVGGVGGGGSMAVSRIQTVSVLASDNTTDWQEIAAALANDIYITAVTFRADERPFLTAGFPLVVEVASGLLGSEALLLTDLIVTISGSSSPQGTGMYFSLSVPVMVAEGTRLVARVIDDDGAAIDWNIQEPTIVIHYYEDGDLA